MSVKQLRSDLVKYLEKHNLKKKFDKQRKIAIIKNLGKKYLRIYFQEGLIIKLTNPHFSFKKVVLYQALLSKPYSLA